MLGRSGGRFQNWETPNHIGRFGTYDLVVNINPICKRRFREQIFIVYSFLSYVRKKIGIWLVCPASR